MEVKLTPIDKHKQMENTVNFKLSQYLFDVHYRYWEGYTIWHYA